MSIILSYPGLQPGGKDTPLCRASARNNANFPILRLKPGKQIKIAVTPGLKPGVTEKDFYCWIPG